VAEWRRFPIWVCLLSVRRQEAAVWQVLTHDACVPSSKTLTLAPRSRHRRSRLAVCSLSPLAHRRLIASLWPQGSTLSPFTWGVGVGEFYSSHPLGHTVVQRFIKSTANLTHPSPARQATWSRCTVSGKRIAERLVGRRCVCQSLPTVNVKTHSPTPLWSGISSRPVCTASARADGRT
jgi:hypothetical protein